jgi:hypothetical protein
MPAFPNQSGVTPVVPVLQMQDGSFVGTMRDDGFNPTMVAFNADGSVRWSVAGEIPQIATADGGVIGQSGITYDASGNATGQMNVGTQSWPGYRYQLGSTDSIFSRMINVAKSWWPWNKANNSGNNTSVPPLWFPKLPSCTDNGGNCATLGAGDLIFNAKQDLISRLIRVRVLNGENKQTCLDQAKSQVFDLVKYGGGLFSSAKPIDAGAFVGYLQGTYLFYDGSASTLNMQIAVCGEGHTSQCGPPIKLKDYFADTSALATASTVTASHPLKTFWRSQFLPQPDMNGFGIGIDPTNFGANLYNESALFHEALHGFTGLYDDDIADSSRLNIFGVSTLTGGHTWYISNYILNSVLSQSACSN